jgi:hypothetical protein
MKPVEIEIVYLSIVSNSTFILGLSSLLLSSSRWLLDHAEGLFKASEAVSWLRPKGGEAHVVLLFERLGRNHVLVLVILNVVET